jgi:hypothetical protein
LWGRLTSLLLVLLLSRGTIWHVVREIDSFLLKGLVDLRKEWEYI